MSELDFSDRPAKTDLLNNGQIHWAFAELIEKAAKPFIVAVVGPWGSGKTTMVNHSLEKLPDNYEIAKFNAWAHSKGMPLLKAFFVHLFFRASEKENEQNVWKKVRDKLKKIAQNPIAQAAPRVFSPLLSTVGVSGEELSGILKKLGNSAQLDIDAEHAETLIDEFKGIASDFQKNGKELLIFVDDLDRCTPTEALDLIDDIKVYLTIDAPVVFIVALDRRTLEMGIKAKYGLESEIDVDEYLQKIFSYVVYIPEYYVLDDFINGAVSCVPVKETIDFLSIAKEEFARCEIRNIRTIKRIVRKWVLLIPSNINGYLKKAGVEESLKSKTGELARYILLLCVLLELYPEHYEILMRFNIAKDIISNNLAEGKRAVDNYYSKYLMAKGGYPEGTIKEGINRLKNKNPILLQIMEGLFTTTFLEHDNIKIVEKAYKKSLPELVKAVHLGIPLIA